MNANPRQYLATLGKPYVTLPDIARALEMVYTTLYMRVRDLPAAEQPEAYGAFRAGGNITMTAGAAADWCERHLEYWAARQAIPRNQRNVEK